MRRPVLGMVIIGLLALAGCRITRQSQSERPAAALPIQPTIIQYVDSDGFDAVFETSLVNQDAAIIVRTEHEKPDWQGRLNAWIAAWNMGGKGERRIARGQIPLPGQIDADFLREFRLLVFGVVDRADELARSSSSWWQEERTRARRVTLLRRYNLRFHMGEDQRISLIFFNGDHSAQYRDFMATLTSADQVDWSRTLECSMCDKLKPGAAARLTSN
jgi:hypothetical protein